MVRGEFAKPVVVAKSTLVAVKNRWRLDSSADLFVKM